MQSKLINIGFGNIIAGGRVVAVVKPESSPSSASFRRRGTPEG